MDCWTVSDNEMFTAACERFVEVLSSGYLGVVVHLRAVIGNIHRLCGAGARLSYRDLPSKSRVSIFLSSMS